jgi:hypothetical protein
MFRQFADGQTAKMLNLPRPRLLGYGWLLVVMMGDNCRCGASQGTLLNNTWNLALTSVLAAINLAALSESAHYSGS